MSSPFQALVGGFRAEAAQMGRSRLFVILVVLQAVTFLFLVSLFGLTGSRAPTAIVIDDDGPYAKPFIACLNATHRSFALRIMNHQTSTMALERGEIVAVITLPSNFSDDLSHGRRTGIIVGVDNVDADMTDDIERALPSAVVAFGHQLHLPDIRLHVEETDLINHDTGFIPYLVVSGLVLDAFVIAGILSAMTVAREFESGTIRLLAVSPSHPLLPITGRILATGTLASIAMAFPVAVVILGYKVVPLHPLAVIGAILLCVAIFSCLGVVLGAIVKRALPVTSLVVGLSLPLYVCSGSLEPERFDGNKLWILAHFSPVYSAVGVLEDAFHGLHVTPESVTKDFMTLLAWAIVSLAVAGHLLRKRLR